MTPTSRRFAVAALLVVIASLVYAPELHARTVFLPAGSVDGLAGAIAAAGPGGTVFVRPGLHRESGTVTITFPVSIVGARRSVIESTTSPGTTYPLVVDPSLHVLGTSGVTIRGLRLRPPVDTTGGCGVLVENSPGTIVSANRMTDYEFGVLVQNSDNVIIKGNFIRVSRGWAADPPTIPESDGIVVINGESAQVLYNRVSDAIFGIFGSDRGGRMTGNIAHSSYIGIILCRAPEDSFLISGVAVGSRVSGTEWNVSFNASSDNLNDGYLVIDGSNHNLLSNNAAWSNGAYDIELAGDTERFGFLAPASFENTVDVGFFTDLVIKDCGNNNTVNDDVVDTTVDPCF